MKVRHTAWGVLLLAAFVSGCGDNGGNPTAYEPVGLGDAALLIADVQPATADSSELVVYGEIYDASLKSRLERTQHALHHVTGPRG